MAVKRRVILYMRTYISTRTKVVPIIDQVYQQISLENQFNFNSEPKYPIFFDRTFFTIFLFPKPIDKRTQSVSTTNGQREIFCSILLFLNLTTTLPPIFISLGSLQVGRSFWVRSKFRCSRGQINLAEIAWTYISQVIYLIFWKKCSNQCGKSKYEHKNGKW